MMDVSPNGIAIVAESELKYINSKGKQLMNGNKMDDTVNAI